MFKILKTDVPSYLTDLIPPSVHEASRRNLRSGNNFQIPKCNTNSYQKSFLIQTLNDWNNLPENIKSLESINQFKNYLKKDIKKAPVYYYIGDRRSQILHVRLRLGCSSLNSDLFRNHLRDDDKCACGHPETSHHYFLECRRYIEIRHETLNRLPFQINTDILLFGCPLYDDKANGEIFETVHRYINMSRRFD